jgi:hypothetical protein
MQMCGDKKTKDTEDVAVDTTATTVVATEDQNQTNMAPANTPEQPAAQQPSSSSSQTVQSPTNSSTTTSSPSPANQNTHQESSQQSQNKTLNLGYAVWHGPVKNGKPNGDGVMRFNSSHRIDSRDPAGNMAEAGDYIDGTYVNGHLDQGTWHKSSGGTEYLVIGQ